MAYSIRSQSAGSGATSSSSGTGTLPTPIDPNDVVVIVLGSDGDDNVTFSDYFDIRPITDAKRGTVITLNVACFLAAGTEDGATFTFTIPAGEERFSYKCWSFSGLDSVDVTAPEGTNSSGNNTAPDPPSETHSNGAANYMSLACCAVNDDGLFDITGFPSTYVDTGKQIEGNSAGGAVGFALKSVSSATEDPGTFTLDTSLQWPAATVMFLETAASGVSGSPLVGPFDGPLKGALG